MFRAKSILLLMDCREEKPQLKKQKRKRRNRISTTSLTHSLTLFMLSPFFLFETLLLQQSLVLCVAKVRRQIFQRYLLMQQKQSIMPQMKTNQ